MRGLFSMKGSAAVFSVSVLAIVGFAGCVDEIHFTPLGDVYKEGLDVVDGVYLLNNPLIEGRFEKDGVMGDWSDAPVLNLEFPTVQIPKKSISPGDKGVSKHLEFDSNSTLHVRVKDASLLTGYTLGWALRLGSPGYNFGYGYYGWCCADGETDPGVDMSLDDQRPGGGSYRPPASKKPQVNPCANLNLNGRQFQPADQEFTFEVNFPGLYVVQAEILKGKERAGMFCEPMVGIVNMHMSFEGEIHPIGFKVPFWWYGDEMTVPPGEYRKMADELTFDVGIPVWQGHHGTIVAESTFRGDWTPDKGLEADLELITASQQQGSWSGCNIAPDVKLDAKELTHHIVTANVWQGGVWGARMGTATGYKCWWTDQDLYLNAGPVPYHVDIRVSYT